MADNLPEPILSNNDLIKQIAMDIGKEVAHRISIMYPKAVESTGKTMLLSVRNSVYNEIIAAIQVNDEDQIVARLAERKAFRRKLTSIYKKIREPRP